MLREFRKKNSAALAKTGDGKTAPTIVGDVVIDPTATVHPTAKVRIFRTVSAAITHECAQIGPNVSIGANAKICAGARIKHSLVLDNAEIKVR